MDDLISRQAAIDAVNSRKTAEQCEAGKTRNWTVDICADMIKQLPPIQPDIVRCKDCKYAEYIDDVQNALVYRVWTRQNGSPQ